MNFIIYGIDQHHKRGEFCLKCAFSHYFLSYFRTDYIAEINGKLVRGKAGDYMILEPQKTVYHGPTPEATKGFRNDWLYLSGDGVGDILKKYPLPLNVPFRLDSTFYLSSAIEKIHKEKSFALVGYEEKCDLILTETLINMYRAYQRNERLTPTERLEQVRGEIMGECAKPWTVGQMATLSGYSKSRFAALYKSYYGISPIDDLIHHRIEQAKLLILYGNMHLTEIAASVGFSSLYYFSKCFKKKEHISPTEYKNKHIVAK